MQSGPWLLRQRACVPTSQPRRCPAGWTSQPLRGKGHMAVHVLTGMSRLKLCSTLVREKKSGKANSESNVQGFHSPLHLPHVSKMSGSTWPLSRSCSRTSVRELPPSKLSWEKTSLPGELRRFHWAMCQGECLPLYSAGQDWEFLAGWALGCPQLPPGQPNELTLLAFVLTTRQTLGTQSQP